MAHLLIRIVAGAAVALGSSWASADLVWSSGDTSGAGGWALQTAPSFLSVSGTGTGSTGETGTAQAGASLAGGYLKAGVATTSVEVSPGFVQPGQASSTVGLEASINLSGPQTLGGIVAVTMTFDGQYSGLGSNAFFQVQTGAGIDGQRGFAAQDTAQRGYFDFRDSAVYGQTLNACTNCSYSIGNDFLISVTTFLPFMPGDTRVIFAAQLLLETQGGFIDGMNTATFSITTPASFTYSSNLMFSPPSAVPAPGSLPLMLAGLAVIALARAQGRRRCA